MREIRIDRYTTLRVPDSMPQEIVEQRIEEALHASDKVDANAERARRERLAYQGLVV
jgi:hypothetical protein